MTHPEEILQSLAPNQKHSNVLAMTVMTVVCFATDKSDTLQANESSSVYNFALGFISGMAIMHFNSHSNNAQY